MARRTRELDLAVDAERGVLLRRSLLVEGRPYRVTELVDVAFDESFPPDTFTFVLPPGETRRPGDEPQAREVSLAEAGELAPFRVFTLDLPEEWAHRASYYPGGDRQEAPPAVSIEFRLPDASHRMLLVARERGSPDPHEDHLKWESQEFDGERLEVSAQPRPMSAYVRLDREGTTITLSSETLGLDRLVTLTRTLKPLRA